MLALDRTMSVRSYDGEGRLHVSYARLSKAAVNDYRSDEIPDADKLGLVPGRIYRLLRDPEELAAAAPSFKGPPILDTHRPIAIHDHPFNNVVGAVGNDVAFDGVYLTGSLTIWTSEAIRGIESGRQAQLSCGYKYIADLRPGTWQGESFDGRMARIEGNHCSLVREGRAGSDCVVGDAALDAAAQAAWGRRYAERWLERNGYR